jgi:hypothetical protein
MADALLTAVSETATKVSDMFETGPALTESARVGHASRMGAMGRRARNRRATVRVTAIGSCQTVSESATAPDLTVDDLRLLLS